MYPDKFINIINLRRWLLSCNGDLARQITKVLGSEEYLTRLDMLSQLKLFADDEQFQAGRSIFIVADLSRMDGY